MRACKRKEEDADVIRTVVLIRGEERQGGGGVVFRGGGGGGGGNSIGAYANAVVSYYSQQLVPILCRGSRTLNTRPVGANTL